MELFQPRRTNDIWRLRRLSHSTRGRLSSTSSAPSLGAMPRLLERRPGVGYPDTIRPQPTSASRPMPASITVVCPECDKEMKAPADAEGKKIRCKGCGASFVALPGVDEIDEIEEIEEEAPKKKPAAKKPVPAKKPEPKKPEAKPAGKKKDDDEDANPYGMTFEDLSARCPECANAMESEDAVICLHCG